MVTAHAAVITSWKTVGIKTQRQIDQSRTGDLETLRGGEPFASLQQHTKVACTLSPHRGHPPEGRKHLTVVTEAEASRLKQHLAGDLLTERAGLLLGDALLLTDLAGLRL